MAEFEVAKLYATIAPKLSRTFEKDLALQIEKAQKKIDPTVTFKLKVNQKQIQSVANQLNHIARDRNSKVNVGLQGDGVARKKLEQIAKTSNKRVKVDLVNEKYAATKMADLSKDRTVKLRLDTDGSTKSTLRDLKEISRTAGGGGSSFNRDLDKLRFLHLQEIAARNKVKLSLELDENNVPARLIALTRDRKVEVKVDVDKSLFAQGNALFNLLSPGGRGFGQISGTVLGGITEGMENLGKSFSRLNDIAGLTGVIVGSVAKVLKGISGVAVSGSEGLAAFGAAMAETAASAGLLVIVAVITAVILTFIIAIAAGTLAIVGFTIAAVVLGAVISALVLAANGLVAAFAGISAALAGIGAAIGVAALALYPIIQAFQQFSNVQNEAGKSTGSTTNTIQQQASALRSADASIRAAKRGIIDANHALEESQYNVIQAQRAVRNASDNLKDAYENQLYARQRLNDAEDRAVENLERLRRAARDAAGEEEDADIRLERARERLAALDPVNANTLDYREALRDVEQAERDLEDTQKDNIRTLKEYNEAKKKGIKGDDDVITAQKALRDASDQILRAKEQQTDAAHNLRNAEFGVTQAVFAQKEAVNRLKDAELDRASAMTKSATAAAGTTAAQRKLSKEFSQLTDRGKEFFETVKGLYYFIIKLSGIAQDTFLPGLNSALKSMMVLGPIAEEAVRNIGTVMGNLAKQFGQFFSSKEAQNAFRLLSSSAAGAIKTMGESALTLIKILLPALARFSKNSKPLLDAFADGLVVISEGIKLFLDNVGDPYTVSSLNVLVKGVAEVARNFIVTFGAFISGTAGILASEMPTIVAGINGFVNGFFRVLQGFVDSGIIEAFSRFIGYFGKWMDGLVSSGTLAALGVTMGRVLDIIGDALARLATDEAVVNSFKQFLRQIPLLTQVFADNLPFLITAINSFLTASVMLTTAIGPQMIQAFSVGIAALSGIILMFTGLIVNVKEKIANAIAIIKALFGIFFTIITSVPSGILNKLGFNNQEIGQLRAAKQGMDRFADSANVTQTSLDGFNGQLSMTGDLFGTAGDKALYLGDAVDTLRQKMRQEEQTARENVRVSDTWKRAKDNLSLAIDRNGQKIVGHTSAAKNNRLALVNATKASYDLMLQDIKSGVPMDQALRRHKDRTTALQNQFGKSKLVKDETQRLIDKYHLVPQNVKTLVSLLGYKSVDEALKAALINQRALSLAISPSQAAKEVQKDLDRNRQRRYSVGGHVDGPGTWTSDSIPAWLSKDEWVIRAKSAMKLGPKVLDYINRNGELPPQFAKGGSATWPMQVNVKKTKIDPNWALFGGAAGNGHIMGWQNMWRALRDVFPSLQLYSGVRPGATTLSGARSYHSLGRAIDVNPDPRIARYILSHFGKNITELITPWRQFNYWHGKPHRFSAAVEAQHGVGSAGNDHIHWAMRKGGLVSGLGGAMSDRILRYLSNGEFVLNARATQALGVKNLRQYNDMYSRSTNPGIHARMGLAGIKEIRGQQPPMVDSSRNIEMNITVSEDHHVDMLYDRINSVM